MLENCSTLPEMYALYEKPSRFEYRMLLGKRGVPFHGWNSIPYNMPIIEVQIQSQAFFHVIGEWFTFGHTAVRVIASRATGSKCTMAKVIIRYRITDATCLTLFSRLTEDENRTTPESRFFVCRFQLYLMSYE